MGRGRGRGKEKRAILRPRGGGGGGGRGKGLTNGRELNQQNVLVPLALHYVDTISFGSRQLYLLNVKLISVNPCSPSQYSYLLSLLSPLPSAEQWVGRGGEGPSPPSSHF